VVASSRIQPLFGVSQTGVDVVELTARQQHPRIGITEHGPAADQLGRQRLEPAPQRGNLPGAAELWPHQLDEIRRALEVTGGDGVADGFWPLAVALVPCARSSVQHCDILGPLVAQVRTQHVSKEMVVAVPPAAVVERHHEQVGAFQRLQHSLPAVLLGDGITQRAVQPIQDRSPQEEAPNMFGLTPQNLLD
jgi:hypothetical protein